MNRPPTCQVQSSFFVLARQVPAADKTLFKTHEWRLGSGALKEESKEEGEERMLEAEEQSRIDRRRAFLMDMHKTQRSFLREHEYVKRCREQICKAVKMWHKNAEKSKEKERRLFGNRIRLP